MKETSYIFSFPHNSERGDVTSVIAVFYKTCQVIPV